MYDSHYSCRELRCLGMCVAGLLWDLNPTLMQWLKQTTGSKGSYIKIAGRHSHHRYSLILELRPALALSEVLEEAPLVGLIKLRASFFFFFFYSICILLKVSHQCSLAPDVFSPHQLFRSGIQKRKDFFFFPQKLGFCAMSLCWGAVFLSLPSIFFKHYASTHHISIYIHKY